jgi:probable O-glycosylation ligase (exosortase A-associated)
MRAWIVMALGGLAVPLAFWSPICGLMAYCWMAYMRPQEMAWGLGQYNVALWITIAMFAGLAVRLKARFFKRSGVVAMIFALWAWWVVTTLTALDRPTAIDALNQISKIFLVCLVTTGLCDNRRNLHWVIVAICGSLAFHGMKYGVHGIVTGGQAINQPIGGMMSGNNENAIAFDIALPFLVYLGFEDKAKWRKLCWWGAAGLTAMAVIFSYSRGGFVGMAAAAVVMIWRTKARIPALFIGAPSLVGLFLLLAPTAHVERMMGIRAAATTDLSVLMRFQAWGVAKEITKAHPIVGIGPKNFLGEAHRFPHPIDFPKMEIHNTYWEFLASSGIPGLLLYVGLVLAAFVVTTRVIRDVNRSGDARLSWCGSMAKATQAAMASFLVASTFGSLMHFDMMYHLCAIAACVPAVLAHEKAKYAAQDAASAPAPAAASPPPEPTPQPALTRYELAPALAAPVPTGLPDFRGAAQGRIHHGVHGGHGERDADIEKSTRRRLESRVYRL